VSFAVADSGISIDPIEKHPSAIFVLADTGRNGHPDSRPLRPVGHAVCARAPIAIERRGLAVSGAAVGCPGEDVRPPISLIGTKETAA